MGIYKVHITTSDTIITFKVNDYLLATISKNKKAYKLIVGEGKFDYPEYTSQEEAIDKAKELITVFFASLGISPKFIMDHAI